jgi:hypothetical protein
MSNYASPQDSTFYAFLKQAKIPVDSKRAHVLKAQMLAGGMPFIKTYPNFTRAHYTSSGGVYRDKKGKIMGKPIDAPDSEGEVKRRNKWSYGRAEAPDTLNITEGSPKIVNNPTAVGADDLIAELAHALQFNKPQTVRDSLNEEVMHQFWDYGYDRYVIPGTVEYEAHQEIEPELRREYDKAHRIDLKNAPPVPPAWKSSGFFPTVYKDLKHDFNRIKKEGLLEYLKDFF